jgi:hypothetical protein
MMAQSGESAGCLAVKRLKGSEDLEEGGFKEQHACSPNVISFIVQRQGHFVAAPVGVLSLPAHLPD